MSEECRDFVFTKTDNDEQAVSVLARKYKEIERKDGGIRVYEETESSNVGNLLYANGLSVSEIIFKKIGLEEYYLRIMSKKQEGK